MIEIKYKDHGAERIASLNARGQEIIERLTVTLWTECMKACGVSNPRPYDTPSKPGEPPRLRTGHGQRNIAYEIEPGRGRVGVRQNAIYMVFLDQGTKRIAPRPWLSAMVEKIWGRLQAIAGGGR